MEWPIVVLVLVLIAGGISTNEDNVAADTVICVGKCEINMSDSK